MSLNPHPFSAEPRFNPWKTIPLNQPWREIAWRFFYHENCLQDHWPSQSPSKLLGPFLGGESEKPFKNLYKKAFWATDFWAGHLGCEFFRLLQRSPTKAEMNQQHHEGNVHAAQAACQGSGEDFDGRPDTKYLSMEWRSLNQRWILKYPLLVWF